MRSIFTFFITMIALCVQVEGSKYSKQVNEQTSDEQAFRSRKAKLIWEKAERQFGNQKSRLDNLASELKELDEEMLKLKLMKHSGEDPYGDYENAVEVKIEALLDKYDMGSKFDKSQQPRSNKILEAQSQQEGTLNSIISKAKELGFSNEELTALEQEIGHHKRKMRELDALIGDYETAKEQMLSEQNELDPSRMKNRVSKEKLIELKKSIKEKRDDLDEGLNRLTLMAEVPSHAHDSEFTQIKVIKLWADILRSNFSEEEKESLKVELMHLEKRMNKHQVLTEQMHSVKKHTLDAKHGKNTDDPDSLHKKHRDLLERTDQLDKHVKKYEKDLKLRISERRHSEL